MSQNLLSAAVMIRALRVNYKWSTLAQTSYGEAVLGAWVQFSEDPKISMFFFECTDSKRGHMDKDVNQTLGF